MYFDRQFLIDSYSVIFAQNDQYKNDIIQKLKLKMKKINLCTQYWTHKKMLNLDCLFLIHHVDI
jgi:hypothetical protein